jgi:polyisoprenoid-binding protein YceI
MVIGKNIMSVRLTALLMLVTMINFTAVYACDESEEYDSDREHNVTNMTVMLSEYLYEIQQNTSKVEFRVDSPVGDIWVSFDDFNGHFAMIRQGVRNDPVIVDINAESLDTDASFIGMMLRSESFFDVENFPSMRFVGRGFEWYGDTRAILKGDLTVQNVTRPVAFYVELADAEVDTPGAEVITVKASTTIKRSEFGIYTLLPIVSDNVNLYMSINAHKVDSSASMVSKLQN